MDDQSEKPRRDRSTLVVCCHLLAGALLVAPIIAAGLSGNLTVLAVGALAALVLVRVLVVNVIPWLERDDR